MTKLIGPEIQPRSVGMEDNDLHLVVNDLSETCKVFTGTGILHSTFPALARGQWGETEFSRQYSDTPPGLWIVTRIYRDKENPDATSYRDRIAYGWYSLAMKGLEDQENKFGRRGIMLHGGGSELGANGWTLPYQDLKPTLGCIRMHNAQVEKIVRLADSKDSTIYISVYQEAP